MPTPSTGGEASRLCSDLGMRALGIDPRITQKPAGMADLDPRQRLEERLGKADFVILTTPGHPTPWAFDAHLFARMKQGAYLINIARGRCAVTQDLIEALRSGHLASAGLMSRMTHFTETGSGSRSRFPEKLIWNTSTLPPAMRALAGPAGVRQVGRSPTRSLVKLSLRRAA